jgi:phosphoenolpyruvate carboxykinase (ATP)
MKEYGTKPVNASLDSIGLGAVGIAHWNLTPDELVAKTLELGQGTLSDTGALMADTGKFTGRSPKDKYIVADAETENTVWWGDVNQKFSSEKFDALWQKMAAYFAGKEIYVRDASVCADPKHSLRVRVITETPWANLFANNLFLRPSHDAIASLGEPDWQVINAPGFLADPAADGTRSGNFTIVNFTRRMIIIGGSAYTGEMKKGMFSVLNYLLPRKGILAMHCSANIGAAGDTAIFFGLSGTGKTTLSADPARKLIGDDEHGWAEDSVFNFEGGCYAKCVNLSKEKEPEIWAAVQKGTLLENVNCFPGTTTVNYDDIGKTENTRAAYPLTLISNAAVPSVGAVPKNIFFLSCDAYGVLPPISKLTKEQAMYYFLSGYTAKVAGTEVGISEPQATFSACFGQVFLPLAPEKYAELLGKKLAENPNINVWLVNTGWSGGVYGVGKRMSLPHTRAIINAALDGSLANVEYENLPIFNLAIPKTVPGVPSEILNPRATWSDPAAYDAKAAELEHLFEENLRVGSSGLAG